MNFMDQFSSNKLVVAHRGYRACYPENTLLSFKKSLGKCDLIELDVGFSKDGMAIVIHDDTLDRTTDVASVDCFDFPYNIVDYEYDMIESLDASSWFVRSDPFGTISQNIVSIQELQESPIQKIPTLKEVLIFLKQNNMPVNVELKDMSGTKFDALATEKVLDIIHDLDMVDMVIISSFNHAYLRQVKKVNPNICIAVLQIYENIENIVEYLKSLDASCYHPELGIANRRVVQKVSDAGIMVNVFTVNDPKDQERLYGYGARSIFTDFL
ncbi:MAG: glycerophosphodiester phosphodiesterase [Sulfurovum sp.]|nr:glycerophosphodiester phosphodiesterase [Sulfurovum sp.]